MVNLRPNIFLMTANNSLLGFPFPGSWLIVSSNWGWKLDLFSAQIKRLRAKRNHSVHLDRVLVLQCMAFLSIYTLVGNDPEAAAETFSPNTHHEGISGWKERRCLPLPESLSTTEMVISVPSWVHHQPASLLCTALTTKSPAVLERKTTKAFPLLTFRFTITWVNTGFLRMNTP